jgi:hypothetical protein
MKTAWCKVFGILLLLFEASMLAMLALPRVRALGPLDTAALIRISISTFSTIAVGIGLLYRRKWAALYFSLALSSIALWLIIASILYVPFPWNLVNITTGVILLLPPIAVIGSWSELTWGGRWYL